MPIINMSPFEIPFLSVTVDVLSRDGKPTDSTYGVDGLMSHLMSLVSKDTRYQGVLEYFQMRQDYDFQVKHKDDIDPDDLRVYVEQLLYSYKNYDEDGERQYAQLNLRSQYSFLDEDGNMHSECDFLVEEPSYTTDDVNRWRKELPYLLKRLNDFGKSKGFLIMSAIISRQKCLKAMKNIKPANLVKYNIVRVDSRGELLGLATEAMGDLHNWLRGDDGYRDAYYNDLMKFIDICSRLGIDLAEESVLNYLCEDIDKMVCDYIIANRDLLMNVASGLSSKLQPVALEYVGKLSLDELDSLPKIITDLTDTSYTLSSRYELVQWTRQKFIDSGEPQKTTKFLSEDIFVEFLMKYFEHNPNADIPCSSNRMEVDNGYYTFKNSLVRLRLDPLYTTIPGYGTEVIIHNKGYLVLIPNRERKDIAYMTVEQAIFTYNQISRGGNYGRNIWSTT